MKKLLFSLLFIFSSLSAQVQWFEYDKALQIAKDENKILMVMLGRDSCSVCKYMKTVVFHDKNVIKKLEAGFIAVYLELDFDDIPQDLTYIGTPTFHFLDKNENAVYRFDGGKTVPSFLKALDEVN
ncbi:MAG: thioredoxin family protein [Helicobacteraceae bacterium]|nr:thioredoxin family protein [Candidatus Sulfurimonas ponti]MBL6974022.1 thioredoxin family protein [Sulfurimonas sp.]